MRKHYFAVSATVFLTAFSACALPISKSPNVALVYRSPTGCQSCADAVATLLENSRFHFKVIFAGPGETTKINAASLAEATLYAQPGEYGSVAQMAAEVESYGPDLRAFVKRGGRYLGFCMGGYLAGNDPGYDLLPGDTDSYISSPGSDVANDASTLVSVFWGESKRLLFFQDGPYFKLSATGEKSAKILAHYASNGEIAALVTPYGRGKVGVSGPHPEATADWYDYYHLSKAQGLGLDLADRLLEEVMR